MARTQTSDRIGKQVSVVNGKRYVYRIADVRDNNGKRIRRAFPSEKKAIAWIKTFKAEQDREHQREQITKNKVGVLADNLGPEQLVDAAQALAKLPKGVSLVSAAEFFIVHHPADGASMTIKELVNDHVANRRKVGRRAKTIYELENLLGRFADFIGDAVVPAVTTADVERWLDSIPGNLDSRDKRRRVVFALFERAVKRELRASNPVAPIEATKEPHRAPAILSTEDVRALLVAAEDNHPELVPYLALAAFCGIRPEELPRLSWTDIHMDRKHPVVYVPAQASKTHKARYVPLPPNAIEWITPHRKQVGHIVWSRKGIEAVAAAARVTLSKDVLRHSFASYNIKLHGDAKTREALGQQSDSIMFKHYVQAVPDVATAEAYFDVRPSTSTTIKFPVENAG